MGFQQDKNKISCLPRPAKKIHTDHVFKLNTAHPKRQKNRLPPQELTALTRSAGTEHAINTHHRLFQESLGEHRTNIQE